MRMPPRQLRDCLRVGLLLVPIVLACGCASGPRAVVDEPVPTADPIGVPAEPGRYEPAAGQGAEVVEQFRAAPPPLEPELAAGTTPEGDLLQLRAQGYVRIGTAYLDPVADANEAALRFGRRAGADKVLLYPPSPAAPADVEAPPLGGATAIYYVRYRLPFGARYRDLSGDEKRTLGVDWGVQIGSVIGTSPAADANLQPGDYVLRLDGKPIPGAAAFTEMLRAQAGNAVTLTIRRGGELLRRMVRLGPPPQAD
jgi:hypothetical protein